MITPQDLRDFEAAALRLPDDPDDGLTEYERAKRNYESWAEHQWDMAGEEDE